MAHTRSPGERAGLSRGLVLDAALALVDRDGLGGLSMRKLGAMLGVEAMTLYHHVPNKEALLDGLVERVFEQAITLDADGAHWQKVLADYARSLRAALLRHPGVLPLAVTRPAATPNILRAIEQTLRMLRTAGFTLGGALDVINSLSVFVLGHTAAEVGTDPVNRRGDPGSVAALAELDPAEFPLLAEAARTGQGTDDESRFNAAVTALLTGFGCTG